MKIDNIKIELNNSQLLINLELYKAIKDIIQLHLTSNQILSLIEKLKLVIASDVDFECQVENFNMSVKDICNTPTKIDSIYSLITNNVIHQKHFYLLKLALNITRFKDYILEKSKLISESFRTSDKVHLMDFAYDYNMLLLPYSVRVAGALLIKVLFEEIQKTESTNSIYESIHSDLKMLPEIEPNTILQIIYAESASQSIRSSSGNNYENRLETLLKANGINYTVHSFDSRIKSVEYDFKLFHNQKSVGVSVKRTLRERYKQNHENIENLDVDAMFLITLGIDLNKDKIQYITQKTGQYIFVASDIYETKPYFSRENKVFPISELSLTLLNKLLVS